MLCTWQYTYITYTHTIFFLVCCCCHYLCWCAFFALLELKSHAHTDSTDTWIVYCFVLLIPLSCFGSFAQNILAPFIVATIMLTGTWVHYCASPTISFNEMASNFVGFQSARVLNQFGNGFKMAETFGWDCEFKEKTLHFTSKVNGSFVVHRMMHTIEKELVYFLWRRQSESKMEKPLNVQPCSRNSDSEWLSETETTTTKTLTTRSILRIIALIASIEVAKNLKLWECFNANDPQQNEINNL